jgi:hypothetical protein
MGSLNIIRVGTKSWLAHLYTPYSYITIAQRVPAEKLQNLGFYYIAYSFYYQKLILIIVEN